MIEIYIKYFSTGSAIPFHVLIPVQLQMVVDISTAQNDVGTTDPVQVLTVPPVTLSGSWLE